MNLDIMKGYVVFIFSWYEIVGVIIVKFEGELRMVLGILNDNFSIGVLYREMLLVGDIIYENYKIFYKVVQVFFNENVLFQVSFIVFNLGQYYFFFQFKFFFNNLCGNVEVMVKIGGVVNVGGFVLGVGLFGLGGICVMDGIKQLMYFYVMKMLFFSFMGFFGEVEI